MTFKNNRGEVPWYVIGLILAIIVLLVSLGAVNKIRDAQKGTTDQANACTILGGTCGSSCTTSCTTAGSSAPAARS